MKRLYGFGTIFRDDTGQRYFYPYGPLGKGYHLTPDRDEEVLKSLRGAWLVLLSGITAFVVSFFAAWALIDPLSSIFGTIGPVFLLFGFAYLLWLAGVFERATSGLRRSNLSTKQVLRLSARNTPWALLLIQTILIAWTALTQLPYLFPAKGANPISVVFSGAFWLVFAALLGHHIWAKTVDRLTHRDS